ncbi:MAG: metallophosphoesterase family protein [Promethearchaeota archaeon]
MKLIQTNKKELLIGLIGDTHIPSRVSEIPKNIINDFMDKNVDYLIHLGDFDVTEVYKNLQKTFGEDKVIAIHGNMDNREIKKLLPPNMKLELYGYKIFITHGTGGPNNIIQNLNKMFDLTEYDIIIFGHIHHPVSEKWTDGKYYICPGTPTDKIFTKINSYGFLRISHEKIEPEIIYV